MVSMTSVRDKRPTRTVNYNETSKPKREKKKKVQFYPFLANSIFQPFANSALFLGCSSPICR